MTAVKTAWRELRKPVFIPASIVIFALIAFAMIWTAIAIYSAASIRQARRAAPLANGSNPV